MLDKIMELFEFGENKQQELNEDELKIATAALLVHAAYADGKMDEVESRRLRAVLADHFGLSEHETQTLLRSAEREESEAVDLHRFTRVVADALDNDQRIEVVRLVWEVVLADGVIHAREDNLVARLSSLLGVSTRDRIRLRKELEAAQG